MRACSVHILKVAQRRPDFLQVLVQTELLDQSAVVPEETGSDLAQHLSHRDRVRV